MGALSYGRDLGWAPADDSGNETPADLRQNSSACLRLAGMDHYFNWMKLSSLSPVMVNVVELQSWIS